MLIHTCLDARTTAIWSYTELTESRLVIVVVAAVAVVVVASIQGVFVVADSMGAGVHLRPIVRLIQCSGLAVSAGSRYCYIASRVNSCLCGPLSALYKASRDLLVATSSI